MMTDETTHELPSTTEGSPDVHVLRRRILAAILDAIFVTLLGWVVNATFGVTHVIAGTLPQPGRSGWSYYTTETAVDWWWIVLLIFGYFFVQEALLSTTAGKAILRLRVIPSSDDRADFRISLWQAFLRNLPRPLEVTSYNRIPYSLVVNAFAILCMRLTKKRQRVGDLLARTIVVDSKTVPSPAYPRFQIYLRTAALLVVLVCFLAFCGVFYYYGRPPLVIQGLQNTHQLVTDGTLQSYTLGSPRWGGTQQTGPLHARITRSAITYPIRFTEIVNGKTRTCTGYFTLVWYGFQEGWESGNSEWRCTP